MKRQRPSSRARERAEMFVMRGLGFGTDKAVGA
ncbi:MAG: hypothetical protein ACI91O_001305 [Candidatus Poriferisodalaceae bacterium]|jgi:hypothetical protein